MLTRISCLAICLLILIPGTVFAEDFPFGTQTFEEALAEAKKDKKPLLVKVYAVWCGPCKRMDKQVFADPKMLALASDFVAIKVDGDTEYGKSFNQDNQVSKYPTTLFFNAEGKEVYRLIGFRNIKGFMDLMDPFLKGTLRPEGSPPPLSTFQVAYRTTFHHAVNTPDQLEKAMTSLEKITTGAPQEEQAMTEYLRGAWLERRVKNKPNSAAKTLKKNLKKHPGSTGASLSKLPLAVAMAEGGKQRGGLQLLMKDVSGTSEEKMRGAIRVAHFLQQGEKKPSKTVLNKLAKVVDEKNPGAGALLSSLSSLYWKAGDQNKALEMAQKANALFPFHPWYAEQTLSLQNKISGKKGP